MGTTYPMTEDGCAFWLFPTWPCLFLSSSSAKFEAHQRKHLGCSPRAPTLQWPFCLFVVNQLYWMLAGIPGKSIALGGQASRAATRVL